MSLLLILLLFSEPWYCPMFRTLEPSCPSVAAMVKLWGERGAEARARRCGATDKDIADARRCKEKK